MPLSKQEEKKTEEIVIERQRERKKNAKENEINAY